MKNLQASVRDRLKAIAKAQSVSMQRLLTLYMQEGLLHRIVCTEYRNKVVLKGGLIFYLRSGITARSTKDIDLLAHDMACDQEAMNNILSTAAKTEVEDGLEFDIESVKTEPIRTQAAQVGVRGHIRGYLGNARNDLQIDMGFGDVITGGPIRLEYRALLGNRTFSIDAYSMETVIAEKLDALVSIGIKNSRIRDLYDLHTLLVDETSNAAPATAAAANTFRHRQTDLPVSPGALSDDHWSSESLAIYWINFLKRIGRDSPTLIDLRSRLLPKLRDIYATARTTVKGEA